MIDWGHNLVLMGWKGETEEADEVMAKLWWEDSYSGVCSTVEQLLFRPILALEFCHEYRRRVAVWLEDSEILKRLSNLRKSGYLVQ